MAKCFMLNVLEVFILGYLSGVLTESNVSVDIGVLTESVASANDCTANLTTAIVQNNSGNLTFNLHWYYVITSELYNVSQAVENSRDDIDFYILASISTCVQTALSYLTGHEIPYIHLCVRSVSGASVTICVPKHCEKKTKLLAQDVAMSAENMESNQPKPQKKSSRELKSDDVNDICQNPEKESVHEGCILQETYASNQTRKYNDATLVSTGSYLAMIVTSIVTSFKWTHCFILYESLFERDVYDVTDAFTDIGTTTWSVYSIDDLEEEDFFKIFKDSMDLNLDSFLQILILCDQKCSDFVNAANTFDVKNKGVTALYHFSETVIISVGTFLEEILVDYILDNVIVVKVPSWVSHNCSHLKKAEESSELCPLVHDITAMIQDITRDLNHTIYEQENLAALVLARMEQYQWSKASLWFPIETLMWTDKGRRLSHVGSVHVHGQVNMTSPLFPNRKFGFNGRRFLVSTLEFYPFVFRTDNQSYDGLCFDIFRELAKDLNFTYVLTVPPDGQWGAIGQNGQWSGLIGQLQREEVDMVVTALTVHSKREVDMDFTLPFYYDSTILLMTKEDPEAKKWKKYLEPFHWHIYICITAALGTFPIIAFVLDKFSPYREQRKLPMWRLRSSVWYMYGALIGRGGGKLPHSVVAQIMVGSWWLICVVLTATYTGNLVAFLAVNKDELPFNSVEEMVQQDVYKWGVIGGSYWVIIFQLSSLSVFQAVYKGMVRFNQTDPEVLSINEDVHIAKVIRGNYVYIGDKSQIEVKMAKQCSLYMGSAEILPVQYSFGLQNESPLTAIFSQKIMEMHENGLIAYWKLKRWPTRDICPDNSLTSAKLITLSDVQSAFYLLGIGISLAIISFFIELVCHKLRIRRA